MKTHRGKLGVMALGLLIGLATGQSAKAQGFVIDRDRWPNPVVAPVPYPIVVPHPVGRAFEIREVVIDARIHEQVADVQVAQTFHNPSSVEVEAEYLFPLPDDAGVQNLVLMVDGKEMPGKILPRDEARKIYEEIVRSRRDPALLEYMGRGLFKTSVFPIPPGADRKVTLRYTQICKRDRDVVEFLYPLGTQKFTSKPIRKLSLSIAIDGKDAIKSVYSPGLDGKITRPGEREAKLTLERTDVVPVSDFRLLYTLSEGAVGATVLSYRPSEGEDGYFLLLASPQVRMPETKALPKTVVFVIDRSGSMAGKKIEQAKNALQFVLNNLRDDDTFNIIAYDDRVETFKPELQRFNPQIRVEAEKFVNNIREGGSTNIDGALKAALAQIPDDSRPNYVLFLTDGLPTAGETNELKIAGNGKLENKAHARVFSFGVGFDVNARLLDRISGGNGGTSEYVRPDEDIEAHVAAFYSKMTRPALASIAVELMGTDINRTYPRDVPDLFEGGQLVWVGRYQHGGKTTIRLSGKVGGERQSFEFPAELASPGTGVGLGHDFVEKLWAVRRVGFIIDQIDLNGPNKELTAELVALSTRYGLLTPYTSFLADERTNLHALSLNTFKCAEDLNALRVVQGPSGVAQRAVKQSYNQAIIVGEALVAYNAPASPATPGGGFAGGGGGVGGGMGGMGGPYVNHAYPPSQPIVVGTTAPGSLAKAVHSKPGVAAPAPAPAPTLAVAGAAPAPIPMPAEAVAREPGQNVRQVGTKTFYRKANRWVDAEVKPEEDAKAVVVEQFSDEFFKLARGQSAAQNQYLSFDEPVTVAILGCVYRIEPPKLK